MADSVDPDEMAHYEPSHLDLHCLHRYNVSVLVYQAERVNASTEFLYGLIQKARSTDSWFLAHLSYAQDEL